MEFGKIIGKTSTNGFEFEVKEGANKFEYIQVKHPEGYNVLCQIIEIEKDSNSTIAKCNVLGYRDENNSLRGLRTPLEPGASVEYASDDFVQRMLGLDENTKGAYIGVLDGREKIKVFLDINKLITKHISVLAKSGSGKTYCVSVLLEEILEKNIPIVVIDPHGEYSSLKYPNNKLQGFEKFDVKGKGYLRNIQEFSPDIENNPSARPLKLSSTNLTGTELMHMLPAKLSSSQIGLLYSALKDVSSTTDFDNLIMSLQLEENNAKWMLINIVDYLKKLNIFSEEPTNVSELVQPAKCSILNLRGVPKELQEIIVYKIVSDLFGARKNGEIPPFLLVVEEAHNYSPERNFGEAKSSSILRQVIAEGRKFGLGVAVISQRPARVDKCLLPNTPVFLSKTGIIPIEKIFLDYANGQYPKVLGLDEKDLKIKATDIKHIVQNKFNGEIFTLKTSRGHEIAVTGEHKFISLNKDFKFFERTANDLKAGDIMIIPSRISNVPLSFRDKISRISHARPVLREHLADFNTYIPSSKLKNNLLKFFNSDIILDKIVSIESKKYSGYVYDVETGLSNFIAGFGGVITHNSMISQCNTQFILKLTNPNDLRAITNSVEGITTSTENEIQNLRIGTAMVVGVVDTPLFVNIRPRRTRHGGEAVDIVENFSNITTESKNDLLGFIQDKKAGKQVLNIIRPKVSKNDIEQLSAKKIKKLQTIIVPCLAVSCKEKGVQFNLIVNLNNGQVVTDIERGTGKLLMRLDKISEKENNLLKKAVGFKGEFSAAQLFNNSGLQFSEVYEAVNVLVKKDYFIKSGNNFQLSEAIKFYLNLKNLASFEKPDFIGLEFDVKQDAKIISDDILENLKRFVEVTGSKEVFIVKYDVEYF